MHKVFLQLTCEFKMVSYKMRQYNSVFSSMRHHQLSTRSNVHLTRFGSREARSPPSNNSRNPSWQQVAKATVFTFAGSGLCFAGCVVWEYENVHNLMSRKLPLIFGQSPFHNTLQKHGEWRKLVNKWWSQQTDGQKIFWPICLLNILVCLAWRIPALEHIMFRYFASNPCSNTLLSPMIFSAFSHHSVVHLACNMFVLHSFSTGAVELLGKEQFVCLYMSGALFSSLASYFQKVFIVSSTVSLGASGAIMAVLGLTCMEAPDWHLSIIFLPMFTFTAASALKAVIMFDSLGVLLKWNFFDHAAHLGGALLGVYWSMRGQSDIWNQRAPILKWYHDLRKNIFRND